MVGMTRCAVPTRKKHHGQASQQHREGHLPHRKKEESMICVVGDADRLVFVLCIAWILVQAFVVQRMHLSVLPVETRKPARIEDETVC